MQVTCRLVGQNSGSSSWRWGLVVFAAGSSDESQAQLETTYNPQENIAVATLENINEPKKLAIITWITNTERTVEDGFIGE